MNFLSIAGISKRHEEEQVLEEVSFIQKQYQKLAIAGETGSGKSTLLKIIAGLVRPDAGTVLFEKQRVQGPDEKLLPGHPAIAYLSQHFELRNNYRVAEILEMANKLPDEEAATIFDVCRISHLLKRWSNQLSGGEKQRIALARLLISSPKLLLLDEPFSNLDMLHKNLLKSVIYEISERLKITCTMISHDPMDTLSWADEILVIKEGAIIQKGSPQQIYAEPANEYIAGLFGSYNLINASQAGAFYIFKGTKQEGKNCIVRPEDFEIVTRESEFAIEGQAEQVYFYGGYCHVDLLLADLAIRVKVAECSVVKGDTIFVRLLRKNLPCV